MDLNFVLISQITLTYLRGSATDMAFIGTMRQIGFVKALAALGLVRPFIPPAGGEAGFLLLHQFHWGSGCVHQYLYMFLSTSTPSRY